MVNTVRVRVRVCVRVKVRIGLVLMHHLGAVVRTHATRVFWYSIKSRNRLRAFRMLRNRTLHWRSDKSGCPTSNQNLRDASVT